MTDESGTSLIAGVQRVPLSPHGDERGQFVELFRNAWIPDFAPVQWNAASNGPNVLRGFHCHVRHTDLVVMLDGIMTLALKDLRPGSRTTNVSQVIQLQPTTELIIIPPGVGHGFYFEYGGLVLNGVSHEWSKEDELGCRWDDRDLDLVWGGANPVISERDRTAGSLEQLRLHVQRALAPSAD